MSHSTWLRFNKKKKKKKKKKKRRKLGYFSLFFFSCCLFVFCCPRGKRFACGACDLNCVKFAASFTLLYIYRVCNSNLIQYNPNHRFVGSVYKEWEEDEEKALSIAKYIYIYIGAKEWWGMGDGWDFASRISILQRFVARADYYSSCVMRLAPFLAVEWSEFSAWMVFIFTRKF